MAHRACMGVRSNRAGPRRRKPTHIHISTPRPHLDASPYTLSETLRDRLFPGDTRKISAHTPSRWRSFPSVRMLGVPPRILEAQAKMGTPPAEAAAAAAAGDVEAQAKAGPQPAEAAAATAAGDAKAPTADGQTAPAAAAGGASAQPEAGTQPPSQAAASATPPVAEHVYEDLSVTQMSQAKDLIEKFKLDGGPVVLHPSLVGFDACNRDGIPLDGARCDALLASIAEMGWDDEEADYGNIAVQECPGARTITEFNHRACEESEFLAPIRGEVMLSYGTLSHSHLHQCLKNLVGGARAKLPTAFIHDGHLSMEAVRRLQPRLAASAERGLRWTVLGHSVRDVPGALELIQSAANRRASVAMKETALQTVARLSTICHRVCGADGRIDFHAARKMLAKTMPEIAGGTEFVGLHRFVVNLGAEGTFIPYLKQFVGMRGANRQLKPATFALAGTLGSSVPHVVCALVVMSYSAPPAYFQDGYSRYLTIGEIRAMVDKTTDKPIARLVKAEEILRWFHRACEELVGHKQVVDQKRLDFMGRLDSLMGRLLCKKHLGNVWQEKCPTMEHLAELFAEELHSWTPNTTKAESVPRPWDAPDGGLAALDASKEGGSKTKELLPSLIVFQDGRALNDQELLIEEASGETVDWIPVLTYSREEMAKNHLLGFLADATTALAEWCRGKVNIERTSLGDFVVSAAQPLIPGAVAFPPSVSGPAFVVTFKEGHDFPANAVDVPDWLGYHFVIMPCLRQPPKGTTVEAFKNKAFLPPFWVLGRTALAGKSNSEFTMVHVSDLRNASFGEPPLDLERKVTTKSMKGSLPVITNLLALKEGEEFVLHVEPPEKKAKARKATTWESNKKARTA